MCFTCDIFAFELARLTFEMVISFFSVIHIATSNMLIAVFCIDLAVAQLFPSTAHLREQLHNNPI